MKLPTKVTDELERYNQNYKTMKASRSLHFHPQGGSVDLDLEFDSGRCVSFTVPPDLAAIILHFDGDKDEWSLDELSRELELPMSHLRRRVHVWQTHSVLVEVATDRYKVDQNGPLFSGNKVLNGHLSMSNYIFSFSCKEYLSLTFYCYLVSTGYGGQSRGGRRG